MEPMKAVDRQLTSEDRYEVLLQVRFQAAETPKDSQYAD
jgi:hypothetical protein